MEVHVCFVAMLLRELAQCKLAIEQWVRKESVMEEEGVDLVVQSDGYDGS